MKKLSLSILLEDEKTSNLIKTPRKPKSTAFQKTGKTEYENARGNLKQYEVQPDHYRIPEIVADELIKKFGTLEDAGIELFGSDTGVTLELDRPEDAKSQMDRAKAAMPQLNAQAQAVKQRPMPQEEDPYAPTPEEEEELKSAGTKQGLPQTRQGFMQRSAEKGPMVLDPQTKTYVKPAEPNATTANQTLPQFSMPKRKKLGQG